MFAPFKVEEVIYKKYFIIDPGKDGGLIVKKGPNVLEQHTVPVYIEEYKARDREGKLKKDKKGNQVISKREHLDIIKYSILIREIHLRHPDATIIIEEVRNIHGVSSSANFKFGENFGILQGIIGTMGIEPLTLAPQTWQKQVITVHDWVYNNKKDKDPKKTANKALRRIFPHLDLRATSRSTVFHDGLVDAVLIGEAAERLKL